MGFFKFCGFVFVFVVFLTSLQAVFSSEIILTEIRARPIYDVNGDVFKNNLEIKGHVLNLDEPTTVDLNFVISREGKEKASCVKTLVLERGDNDFNFTLREEECDWKIQADPGLKIFSNIFAETGVYELEARLGEEVKFASFAVTEDFGVAIPSFPLFLVPFLALTVLLFGRK